MAKLEDAAAFAQAHEIPWTRDPAADQTFSVAKTYLALLAGIAHSRELLDPGERVCDRTVRVDPENDAVVVVRWLDGAHSAGLVRVVAEGLRN